MEVQGEIEEVMKDYNDVFEGCKSYLQQKVQLKLAEKMKRRNNNASLSSSNNNNSSSNNNSSNVFVSPLSGMNTLPQSWTKGVSLEDVLCMRKSGRELLEGYMDVPLLLGKTPPSVKPDFEKFKVVENVFPHLVGNAALPDFDIPIHTPPIPHQLPQPQKQDASTNTLPSRSPSPPRPMPKSVADAQTMTDPPLTASPQRNQPSLLNHGQTISGVGGMVGSPSRHYGRGGGGWNVGSSPSRGSGGSMGRAFSADSGNGAFQQGLGNGRVPMHQGGQQHGRGYANGGEGGAGSAVPHRRYRSEGEWEDGTAGGGYHPPPSHPYHQAPPAQQHHRQQQRNNAGFPPNPRKRPPHPSDDPDDFSTDLPPKRTFHDQPEDETPPPAPSSFVTAYDKMLKDNAKKGIRPSAANKPTTTNNNTNASASSSSSIVSVGKKLLGTSGKRSKFVSPLLSNKDKDTDKKKIGANGGGEDESGEPVDERLKNIEPRMIEAIMNEIIDKGGPISWEDIAGLEHAKNTIKEVVVWPMLRPDIFTGLRGPPKGLLLFGPPGKTLIGKCIASQSGATFFSISSSSLTSKWVGDGEKMVRALFAVARVHQPSVIFVDEIDSLLTQRTDGEVEASRRIKTEFLVQFDGCGTDSEDRILLIGATNRPHEIDEAARRRFRKKLYIPLPESEARLTIMLNLLKKQKHSLSEEQVEDVVRQTEGYSGSDMDGLIREAALGPIRDIRDIRNISADDVRPVTYEDFVEALTQVRASVSDKDLDLYLRFDGEDTHGWQLGHGNKLNSSWSANWADFAVFATRMKELAAEKDVELFVTDSGDTHDGTSLGDNTGDKVNGFYTMPMIKKTQAYDVLTAGNHEMYKDDVWTDMKDDFSPYWQGKYVGSNVYYKATNESTPVPIAPKYRAFQGTKGTNVVSFGFLFNFTVNRASNAYVNPIANEVQEPWFTNVLNTQPADFYLLVGHVGLRQSRTGKALNVEWQAAVDAIRKVHPTKPIVIFGGHNHARDYAIYGPNTYALAAGRFMETVGFLSLSKNGTVSRRYLNANVPTYNFHLGESNLALALGRNHPLGREINRLLDEAVVATNATAKLGCAPRDYYLNRVPVTDPSSLYYILERDMSDLFRKPNSRPIYTIINSGSQRTDIYAGEFTLDDANAVSPFGSKFYVIPEVPFSIIRKLKAHLEANITIRRRQTPCPYTLGYVTDDDLSSVEAGDDTLHCPFPVAQLGQSNIYSPVLAGATNADDEMWDLVFFDFIELDVVNSLNALYVADGLAPKAVRGQNPLYLEDFVGSQLWPLYAAKYWQQC
ncbi:hypothetical protein HDV05_002800 [Chytridiales sp. JEL 0842]|nr:hypothetical protein HDV05_002800 [Chytridiales sp. JEL 0842]